MPVTTVCQARSTWAGDRPRRRQALEPVVDAVTRHGDAAVGDLDDDRIGIVGPTPVHGHVAGRLQGAPPQDVVEVAASDRRLGDGLRRGGSAVGGGIVDSEVVIARIPAGPISTWSIPPSASLPPRTRRATVGSGDGGGRPP